MNLRYGIGLLYLIFPLLLFSQKKMENYSGGWRGQLPADHSLAFKMDIEAVSDQMLKIKILHKKKTVLHQEVALDENNNFQLPIAQNITLAGRFNDSKKKLDGFVQTMFLQYYLSFSQKAGGHYEAKWNPWIVEKLTPTTIYLAVDNAKDNQYEAYPFFDEARFPGTFAADFQKKEEEITFIDIKSGLQFKGILKDKKIDLSLHLGDFQILGATLSPFAGRFPQGYDYPFPASNYQMPKQLKDGLPVSSLNSKEVKLEKLQEMADSIQVKKLTHTHSVLVSYKNHLVYEKYFYGYREDIPHDTRSAQKSISSAMLGIAIRDGLVKNEQQYLYDLIPEKYQYTKAGDPLKGKISLQDILTMSSGLDAIDYGIDRRSVASEGAYQSTPDWTQTILEAPMVNPPGKEGNYGSANPHLIGVVVNEVIDQPLNFYMNDELFAPLGIDQYILQNDRSGNPYFGGGMYLSSRALLKFGMLYLNKGMWKGKRILPESWVEKSFQKHTFLANDSDKNKYGYFWWHDAYPLGNKSIASVEARGAGGQYIFVVPEYDMVVVITSGNYRNGRFWQPEKIMEEYILPAFVP